MIGGHPDHDARDQPGQIGPEDGHADIEQKDDAQREDGKDNRGGIGAHVQGARRVLALAGADKEHADDRGQDAGGGKDKGQRDIVDRVESGVAGVQRRAQNHDRDDAGYVGVKDVSTHSCHVTDVIADIVGDHSGVARVVLRQAQLDLAHQVGADVCRFGIDPAAGLGQQGQRAGAKAKAEDDLGVLKDQIEDAHAEHGQPDDRHTHDAASAKGQRKRFGQSILGCCGRFGVGDQRDLHAKVARQGGAQSAQQIGHRRPQTKHKEQDGCQDDVDDDQSHIECLEIGIGPIFDRALYACGLLGADRGLVDPVEQIPAKEDGYHSGDWCEDDPVHRRYPLSFPV